MIELLNNEKLIRNFITPVVYEFSYGMVSSTIENKIGNLSVKSTHTTADALQINQMLNEMIDFAVNIVL